MVILGAGLSGLGCARTVPGATIFEARAHPGGHVYSHALDGVSFDEGAHICHSRDPEWLKLIFDAAGDVYHFDRSIVRCFWRGHWVTYPVQNHLAELPVADRITALRDLVRAQVEQGSASPADYEQWCLQHYGRFLTDHFYQDYTRKYWRVSMAEMATDWLKGRLLPSELDRIIAGAFEEREETQSVFSSFHYPARGGFFQFFGKLYDRLDVRCGQRAVRVDADRREVHFESGHKASYERLVSTIPLPDLVRITDRAPAAVRDAASRLRHTQLICVNMVVAREHLSDNHWFYVYGQDIDVSRVKVISNIAAAAVPEGCTALQCEIFRRGDESFDVEPMKEKAVRDMGSILGFSPGDVRSLGVVHAPHAYPISDLGRAERVAGIHRWLEGMGIHSIGLCGRWRFVWSDAAYLDGVHCAMQVAALA